MDNWNDFRKQTMTSVAQLGKISPQTLAGVKVLEEANKETNILGPKICELIALACAITTRCDGCIAYHTEAALKAGATEGEIAEALNVGIYMNAGAAVIYSSKVIEAVSQMK